MPKRRLTLHRETLTELTGREIAEVVGAAASMQFCFSLIGNCGPNSLPDCNSLICTNGWCASDFQQCTTG